MKCSDMKHGVVTLLSNVPFLQGTVKGLSLQYGGPVIQVDQYDHNLHKAHK